MTLAGKTVYQNGSIDTGFEPPLFSLDSAFNNQDIYLPIGCEIRYPNSLLSPIGYQTCYDDSYWLEGFPWR
jgi:hypothetical protein